MDSRVSGECGSLSGALVEAVALYPNRDDLFRNYPGLEPDDIRQALEFAAANLEDISAETA